VRPNGQPDYQLWAYTDLLARYKGAAAVLVESLDLMPRSLLARIRNSWLELASQPRAESPLPPVIAVSRAAALVLEGEGADLPGKVSFSFSTRREPAAPAHNVVAMLPGSDAALSRDVVLVSANSASAMEAGSLLAVAEALATSGAKTQRPVVFLWTAAIGGRDLGAAWFSLHPALKTDRVAARIDVASYVGCPDPESAAPTDYARYASDTQSLLAAITDAANGARRANAGGAPPACAR